jgi:hypothetical protein
MLEDNMVKVGKKAPNFLKKGSKVSSQKKFTVVQCWFTHGQKPDERNTTHPMDRTTKLVHWWVLVHSGPY